MPPAMDDCRDWSGVTGLFVPCAPAHCWRSRPTNLRLAVPIPLTDALPRSFAIGRVEGNQARVGLAADHHDEQVVFQDGRAADAEEGWGDFPIGGGVTLPNNFAGFKIEAEELAFRSEGITAV